MKEKKVEREFKVVFFIALILGTILGATITTLVGLTTDVFDLRYEDRICMAQGKQAFCSEWTSKNYGVDCKCVEAEK